MNKFDIYIYGNEPKKRNMKSVYLISLQQCYNFDIILYVKWFSDILHILSSSHRLSSTTAKINVTILSILYAIISIIKSSLVHWCCDP